jgi:hypothetical protein
MKISTMTKIVILLVQLYPMPRCITIWSASHMKKISIIAPAASGPHTSVLLHQMFD